MRVLLASIGTAMIIFSFAEPLASQDALGPVIFLMGLVLFGAAIWEELG